MRAPDWHDHVVSGIGVDDLLILAWVSWFGNVEADFAFGHEEGLIVHFVPVRRGAGCLGWHDEFGCANAVVWILRESKQTMGSSEQVG